MKETSTEVVFGLAMLKSTIYLLKLSFPRLQHPFIVDCELTIYKKRPFQRSKRSTAQVSLNEYWIMARMASRRQKALDFEGSSER